MKHWKITKFQMVWNPFKNYGGLMLFLDTQKDPLTILIKSPEEFNVLQNILKYEPLYYFEDGYIGTAPEIPLNQFN